MRSAGRGARCPMPVPRSADGVEASPPRASRPSATRTIWRTMAAIELITPELTATPGPGPGAGRSAATSGRGGDGAADEAREVVGELHPDHRPQGHGPATEPSMRHGPRDLRELLERGSPPRGARPTIGVRDESGRGVDLGELADEQVDPEDRCRQPSGCRWATTRCSSTSWGASMPVRVDAAARSRAVRWRTSGAWRRSDTGGRAGPWSDR